MPTSPALRHTVARAAVDMLLETCTDRLSPVIASSHESCPGESPEVIPGRRLGCPSFQVVVVSSGNACATPLAGPASYPTSVHNPQS